MYVNSFEPTIPEKFIAVVKNPPYVKKLSGLWLQIRSSKISLLSILYLASLINSIFKFKFFLTNWKMYVIFPTYKPEDLLIAKCYHPGSLLIVLHKLIENNFLRQLGLMPR